jgi:hypothetical protein
MCTLHLNKCLSMREEKTDYLKSRVADLNPDGSIRYLLELRKRIRVPDPEGPGVKITL